MDSTEPPAGFKPLFRSSPYLETIGPFFCQGVGENLTIGLRVLEKHTNARPWLVASPAEGERVD